MCSNYSLSLLLVTICFATINAVDVNYTVKFLSKYGYLPQSDLGKATFDEKSLAEPVKKCQKMAGLPTTGKIDKQTDDLMHRPRCGVIDPPGGQRFVLQSKWNKKHLTYRILQYTEKLRREDVDREIAKAFAMWASHTELTFTPTTGRADIEIRFNSGTYNSPFDGPGGTLAYAYFPQNGDVYFDENEIWTLDNRSGTSLFNVALHEFGHSLGLAHSNDQEAVMYPWYKSEYLQLANDDISGIQTLYGRKTGSGAQPPVNQVPVETTPKPVYPPKPPVYVPQRPPWWNQWYPHYPNRWPQNPYYPKMWGKF